MKEETEYLKGEANKGNIIAMLTLGDRYRDQYPRNLKKIEKSLNLYRKVLFLLDQELLRLRGNKELLLTQEIL